MSTAATHLDTGSTKRGAALQSVLAAAGITILKIITGVLTGSLGMLSEAAHSGIDLIAAAITLYSVRASDKPADEDHTYGHGKIEALSALIETALMLVSCVWIVVEAVRRIFGERLELKISVWPILVLLLSIVVDYTRSRNLAHVAKESKSQALEADAMHFATDIWSSAAVLFGLAATYAGQHYGIHALEFADPIAALVVSIIILRVTWRLANETVHSLLDSTTPEQRREVTRAIEGVEGVLHVDRVRMRQSGAKYFADVSVQMPRNMSFQRTEQLVREATAAVARVLPDSDIVIHTVPVAPRSESVFDRVRAVAQRSDLNVHDVTVQEYPAGLHVEQHLEVAATMPLREAHDLATKLELEMCREIPGIATIATHIESEEAIIEKPVPLDNHHLEEDLVEAGKHFPKILDVHNIVITRMHDRLQLTCHCTMPDALPMSEVHDLISQLESAFRSKHPEIARMLIHPEPATDNMR